MLYSPKGDFTITNNFATNSFGELGLAVGDKPLIQPTQVALPNSPEAEDVEADNAARAIVLDDGSSTNFIQTGNATQCNPRPAGCLLLNGNLTPPYISNDTPYRVEAVGRQFHDDDVIFTQGGNPSAPTYRFEPTETVVWNGENSATPVEFENTRTAAPDDGQIEEEGVPAVKVASFNVLNYFTATWVMPTTTTSVTAAARRSGTGTTTATASTAAATSAGPGTPRTWVVSRRRSSAPSTRSTRTWSA